jgi:hypothetical protein
VAEEVDGMVCCPDDIPEDCEPDSWDFSPQDGMYGCCTQDLTQAVGCYQGWHVDDCDDQCEYIDMYGGFVGCPWW